MILSCPNCATQYVVKDGAIPPQGRQVRCASCQHSWHPDPETGPSIEEPEAGLAPDDSDESIAEAALIEPRSGPEAEERAFESALIDEATAEPAPKYERMEPSETPAQFEELLMPRRAPEPATVAAASEPEWQPPAQEDSDDFSPFAADDEDDPRGRNPLLTLVMIALLVAALAATFWFLAPPEWKARVGLGGAGTSPLAFVITHRERRQLESGNQLLTISGRIINPTSTEQSVPPIRAQLKTRQGKVIYSWTIAPPTRSLPPGASKSFNSAEINVPPGGDDVTITTASDL